MNEQDYKTVEMMEKYGGSFVKQLAKLCHLADPLNLDLIKITWAHYWKDYEDMAKKETEK